MSFEIFTMDFDNDTLHYQTPFMKIPLNGNKPKSRQLSYDADIDDDVVFVDNDFSEEYNRPEKYDDATFFIFDLDL